MKIAIMGAGLSGLACGITLEKHGMSPTIFERRGVVGDRFVNGEIMLSILNRPINNSIGYLSEEYGIHLKPTGNIKELRIFSENKEASIKGQLGFSNIRGRDEDSYEMQLYKQFRGNVVFNSRYTYEELLQDFTHVILATGDAADAKKIQNYKEELTVTIRGVMVEGDFDRYKAAAWLDNNFAPQGYGYCIPISEEEANIVIAYPDYPHNKEMDINQLWSNFYDRACRDLKQDLRITDKFEITRYIIGMCQYPRIGNTFFVGNNFGSIMPFLGFGQFAAILTGVYGAKDILGQGKYEELTNHLRKSYNNSLVLRRSLEKLNNQKLDLLVGSMNNRVVERIFNTKHADPLRYLAYLLRPLSRK
ncbi:NAD(P)/FAD-dependent oxidoreductase [Alkaliphilus serpentinus]|uniref:NAD(P)/FAD-dependent oxidoreductase n=1 Tax=Alkaliphilus serpentinus TaxID=1482731 RepID=A0A833HP84_9FIRM|nr:NAD(P)/FAD-dependent oxidoreductase [Alkaliphilus serpentinus]KAB3530520.1 NAD(P)/FAD-dependent oxidoreductase [Alkaliphilus serpentinus]